jgi:hypothetical protein
LARRERFRIESELAGDLLVHSEAPEDFKVCRETVIGEIDPTHDPYHLGSDNKVTNWAEMIVPDAAKALACYEHGFLGKYPALTRNQCGEGALTYEGTVLSDKLQRAVLLDVLKDAGIVTPDQNLPPSREGAALLFQLFE